MEIGEPVSPPIPLVADAGPSPPPCAITSATILHAPDGTADTRTTVGLFERIRFTAVEAADWTASNGTPTAASGVASFVWTAPEDPGTTTITARVRSGSCSITITTIIPSAITMAKASEDAVPAGVAGAGMRCSVSFSPMNVCFGRTQWLEVAGGPSGISGYFVQFTGQAWMNHSPNPNFVTIGINNIFNHDHCSIVGLPAPYSAGSYQWVIPNQFRGVGGSAAHAGPTTVQIFTIAPGGTVTVSKQGASVTRSP